MEQQTNFLPILGTDHIEFYVGNAKQAAYYYQKAFGFELIAYAGLETGSRDKASYVLKQDKVILVFTSSFDPESDISQHVRIHGDGVKVLALSVPNAVKSFEETIARGATKVMSPTELCDKSEGSVSVSAIKTYGDTIHKFVDRSAYKGVFMPGYKPVEINSITKIVGFEYVDHCVGNVELGKMDEWEKFYIDVMGFKNLITYDDNDISTEYSALMSKVVTNGNGYIKYPINEPADSRKNKSQIQEYLDFYRGPGVQHIALATKDIIYTVSQLRQRGVEFLQVPETYYEDVLGRMKFKIKEGISKLKELNILIDEDDQGYMLQIFTKPVTDRPTLFFEIIQRHGAKTFGKGNFKALFEAIEREQSLRGNL